LLVTVIRMDEPQYARMAATGFSVIEGPERPVAGRDGGDAARNSLPADMSIAWSSFFFSSDMVKDEWEAWVCRKSGDRPVMDSSERAVRPRKKTGVQLQ